MQITFEYLHSSATLWDQRQWEVPFPSPRLLPAKATNRLKREEAIKNIYICKYLNFMYFSKSADRHHKLWQHKAQQEKQFIQQILSTHLVRLLPCVSQKQENHPNQSPLISALQFLTGLFHQPLPRHLRTVSTEGQNSNIFTIRIFFSLWKTYREEKELPNRLRPKSCKNKLDSPNSPQGILLRTQIDFPKNSPPKYACLVARLLHN